jgi:hypothetical protein
MHQVMAGYVTRGEIPGLVTLVNQGEDVHVDAMDPKNDLAGILLTQRAWISPRPPDVCQDFGTLAYGALDD